MAHQHLALNRQHHQHRAPVNFSPKKCWICLEVFDLDDSDHKKIQYYFCLPPSPVSNTAGGMTSRQLLSRPCSNDCKLIKKIHLVIINQKIVMIVCKCRKKLAHLDCFNNYIDLKQKGNININIYCSQCSYKYEFDYPYNGWCQIYLFIILIEFKLYN